jgi:hypothetical protein
MSKEFTITLSAEEVNIRSHPQSLKQGEDPILLLLPRNGPKIAGKTHYTSLLTEKLAALVPDSSFSTDKGQRLSKEGIVYLYLKCQHKVLVSVAYTHAELQIDHELTLTATVKCKLCLDPNQAIAQADGEFQPAQPALTAQPVLPAQPNIAPLSAVVFRPPSAASSYVQQIVEGLSAFAVQMDNICGNTADPLRTLTQNKERFRNMVVKAYDDIAISFPPLVDEEIIEEEVPSSTQQATTANVQSSGVPNAFNRLMNPPTQKVDQAQKRKIEAKAAAAKKAKNAAASTSSKT